MSTYSIVRYKTQNQSSTEHDNSDKFPKRGITLHEVGNFEKMVQGNIRGLLRKWCNRTCRFGLFYDENLSCKCYFH